MTFDCNYLLDKDTATWLAKEHFVEAIFDANAKDGLLTRQQFLQAFFPTKTFPRADGTDSSSTSSSSSATQREEREGTSRSNHTTYPPLSVLLRAVDRRTGRAVEMLCSTETQGKSEIQNGDRE